MEQNKINKKALYNIAYGLYVVTCNDGKKDNGLIVNTVIQVTSDPMRIAVTINKQNYSHDVIKETGKMNVNCLTTEAPFSLFEKYGFQSGRDVNKFENTKFNRLENDLVILSNETYAEYDKKMTQNEYEIFYTVDVDEEQFKKENIGVAIDFYNRFCWILQLMMEHNPDNEFISFMVSNSINN